MDQGNKENVFIAHHFMLNLRLKFNLLLKITVCMLSTFKQRRMAVETLIGQSRPTVIKYRAQAFMTVYSFTLYLSSIIRKKCGLLPKPLLQLFFATYKAKIPKHCLHI